METQTNVTMNPPRFHVGFFFISLGVLISLITSVVSFLNLVFETLNKRFPDVLNATYQYGYSTWSYEGIRTALATLIIVFPVFLILSYYWNRYAAQEIGRWDVFVKKWQINIILFLASLVVVIDLVTLVRYFISGEITARFIYKVLAILVVVGIVGFYYISRLKDNWKLKKMGMITGIVAAILVVAAIAWSFTVMGSPQKQRDLRLDDRRVNDLQNIQYQVINYWQRKEKLPASLSDLSDPLSGWSLPVDPEFEKGNAYEYAAKGPLQFELCATFAQPMPKGWQEYGGGGIMRPMMPAYDKAVSYPYPGGGANESWDHEKGRTCFSRTIDKELYPPYPKDAAAVYAD